MPKRTFLAGACAFIACTLSGCASEVPMQAAPDANNPLCAQVTVRLPSTIGTAQKRATNAQATGAWGTPAAVLLRCGLPPSAPTLDPCISVNQIDWTVDSSQAPRYRFVAYGRNPGLEVFVDSSQLSGTDALLELSTAVAQLPQERQCSSYSNELSDSTIKIER